MFRGFPFVLFFFRFFFRAFCVFFFRFPFRFFFVFFFLVGKFDLGGGAHGFWLVFGIVIVEVGAANGRAGFNFLRGFFLLGFNEFGSESGGLIFA